MSLHPDILARLTDNERQEFHAACDASNAADAELRAAGARYTAAAEARRRAEIEKEDAMRHFSEAVERQSVALAARTRLQRDLLARVIVRGGGAG